MKMTSEKRALDKIFRRRDRYEIPDWQREEVWDTSKKQRLIDSILRGWKLPKLYFVKNSDREYEVVDGQQRLQSIFEFCSNELSLSKDSAKRFGGHLYSDLTPAIADSFDDFEIEYDVIEDAKEEELKEFFLRLQEGLPLTSSEKLNAVHSKLRDYCRSVSKHAFFKEVVAISDVRYSHFDIVSKVATIEIEGLETGIRFDDIKAVFESQSNFSSTSAVAKRIKTSLDFLYSAFKDKGTRLRTRTVVQSLVTLTCKLVASGRHSGMESSIRKFYDAFASELVRQIEMGQTASDSDYIVFQRSVNANVKGGAMMRHQILLRKLFTLAPSLTNIFDPTIIAESGVTGRVDALGYAITNMIDQLNKKYSAVKGEDLFKATNKTAQALVRVRKVVKNLDEYNAFIDDLYFLFREAAGQRLENSWPVSFTDVNDLRTDLRHDIDHGNTGKVRSKRRRIGKVFIKYAGAGTPATIDPTKFPLFQSNLMGAIEGDLRALLAKTL
ncbi:MAG: DUF262 domain-containing protein [Nitrospiraceae bacterium]|nr:MAG: DUF262 domain-containing protein [Nitrospiraceae bacterium]